MIDLADLEAKARAATKDWVHRTSADDAGFIVAAQPSVVLGLIARVRELEEALEWYAEQARLCRLIHSEGDPGRWALSADGGKRARTALGGSK